MGAVVWKLETGMRRKYTVHRHPACPSEVHLMSDSIRRHWKRILALLGVPAVADLLKEFVRSKLMDWGFWKLGWVGKWLLENPFGLLTTCIILIILWLTIDVIRKQESSSSSSAILDDRANPFARGLSPRFTLLFCIGSAAVCALIAYGAIEYYSRTQTASGRVHRVTMTMPPEGWVSEWGLAFSTPQVPIGVRSIVNVKPIIPYRDYFRLMLICLVKDDTVDERENPKIEKSSLFSVGNDPTLAIDMSLGQELVLAATPPRVGTFVLQMRQFLVLLPRSVRTEQISRVSDVERYGGSIMSVNGFPLTITREVHMVPARRPSTS
jgi:uncharacterized membrane protein